MHQLVFPFFRAEICVCIDSIFILWRQFIYLWVSHRSSTCCIFRCLLGGMLSISSLLLDLCVFEGSSKHQKATWLKMNHAQMLHVGNIYLHYGEKKRIQGEMASVKKSHPLEHLGCVNRDIRLAYGWNKWLSVGSMSSCWGYTLLLLMVEKSGTYPVETWEPPMLSHGSEDFIYNL